VCGVCKCELCVLFRCCVCAVCVCVVSVTMLCGLCVMYVCGCLVCDCVCVVSVCDVFGVCMFVTLRANFYSWIFSHIGVTVVPQLLTVLR